MYPVSFTNIHHDVTDLLNQVWLKIQKLEYLESKTTFLRNKNILDLCLWVLNL